MELINVIRSAADDHQQDPKPGAIQGSVRMFCTRQPANGGFELESQIAQRMAQITGDEQWAAGASERKTLILEHKMAGRRLGFEGILLLFTQLSTCVPACWMERCRFLNCSSTG